MSLLEIDNISVFYEDFQALYDISIKIEEGDIFACIGANGAGKSTMLKTVAGVLMPKRGRILFDGEPIDNMPPHKRVELGISSVPEGRRVFPSLTVHENLLIGVPQPQRSLDYGRRLRAVPAASTASQAPGQRAFRW